MSRWKHLFSTTAGILLSGAFIGVVATTLQKLGNPPNMGVCVACFERDIAGALGLHGAAVVQYLRPEIPGFVLGSLVAALLTGEFRPRCGSTPVVRFFLGVFAMIGALVFLGCPWRALLRLSAGDGNAILGLAGLAFGVWIGTLFFRKGYSLGRSKAAVPTAGWIFPAFMLLLILFRVLFPPLQDQVQSGILRYSLKGPGSQHAPLVVSVTAGLIVGFVAQRSRFCTMGALRDLFLFRHFHLFLGITGLFVAAFLTNLIYGQFHPGFAQQPIAHNQHLWNFLGMSLAGLAFALAGGCPGRQLILAGEGDGDAAVFVLGMIVGAAFSHNFGLAASPKGIGPHSVVALILGFLFCLWVGFTSREEEV
ncbi:YedE family putative selenium transporter [Thermodesulforhabdus norvegica]|uniref:Uncharacterized protein n=1 Tax=Thermodesulforhabdus norvegica TaxID=39841 RepID=A0A1I4TS79_9BACT|nr:YedE family putative selenium transporter [Thermodesulforhabdus norvegica]SFM79574.1 hypothetical protein SAMN05660836_01491 [Thermodesulforhabdus norvegica]